MRKTITLAAGLALLATSALGQGSWRERDDDRRGGRDDHREWSRDRDRDEPRRSMRDSDDDHSGPSRAARFVLRSGEARMAVRCDERESMRACVDAALTMFDRVRSSPAASSTSAPATSSPASPGASPPAASSPAR